MIYQSSPDPAPDSDFVPGELSHLVLGNQGRLLDARRTPIEIVAVAPATGSFALEVCAFEDAGARWELSLERVARFQFRRGAARVSGPVLAELERAFRRFDRILEIQPDPAARDRTVRRVDQAHAQLRPLIDPANASLADHVRRREGSPVLTAQLHAILDDRGLGEIDSDFARTFVTNPDSGEVVKGHAIVLAELGLCAYRGQVVRDPETFAPPWSKASRAEHLITRLAFSRALWRGLGCDTVLLYRGVAIDAPLPASAPRSFVSATFSEDVAQAHFAGGPTTHAAALWRQQVPVSRLLMSFLETAEMSERFREAEAVLIADPGNRMF